MAGTKAALVSETGLEDAEFSKPTANTKLAMLNNAEKFWTWKAGLRIVLCVLNIIAIGCVGWLRSTTVTVARTYTYGYYANRFGYGGLDIGAIVTFLASFIWCALAISIPFILKRTRPLHPGIAVGVDLVFWGGFIVIGLFSLAAVFDVVFIGSGGYMRDPNYNRNYMGSYYQASNGTWLYNITWTPASSGRYNTTTGQWTYPPLNLTGVVRSCTPMFSSCEQQDEYVNSVWRGKAQRIGTTICANAIAWLNVLFHFTLFVWACVDTHRHNRKFTTRKEQKIADRVISDLEKRGVLTLKNGVPQPIGTPGPN